MKSNCLAHDSWTAPRKRINTVSKNIFQESSITDWLYIVIFNIGKSFQSYTYNVQPCSNKLFCNSLNSLFESYWLYVMYVIHTMYGPIQEVNVCFVNIFIHMNSLDF